MLWYSLLLCIKKVLLFMKYYSNVNPNIVFQFSKHYSLKKTLKYYKMRFPNSKINVIIIQINLNKIKVSYPVSRCSLYILYKVRQRSKILYIFKIDNPYHTITLTIHQPNINTNNKASNDHILFHG